MRLVGGAEPRNELAPYPHIMVEHGERYLGGGGPPLRSEGFHSHTRIPSPESQYWEEESLQHLAVKMTKDSVCPGEMEGCWKYRCLFKGLTYRLTHLQALIVGSSGGTTP